MARPEDPLLNYKFRVECDSIIEAAFSEVSGLNIEIETEDYAEGGVNDFVHKLPKGVKLQNIVLKRGLTASGKMWKWIGDSINGKFDKKNLGIILVDKKGKDKWRWTVENAFPVKWTGPELKASSPEIAIETLELAHTGIKNSKKK